MGSKESIAPQNTYFQRAFFFNFPYLFFHSNPFSHITCAMCIDVVFHFLSFSTQSSWNFKIFHSECILQRKQVWWVKKTSFYPTFPLQNFASFTYPKLAINVKFLPIFSLRWNFTPFQRFQSYENVLKSACVSVSATLFALKFLIIHPHLFIPYIQIFYLCHI